MSELRATRTAGGRLRAMAIAWVSAIVFMPIVVAIGSVMHLVTSFLFAYSGGGYSRMPPIVNVGTIIAIGSAFATGVVTAWRAGSFRSGFGVMLRTTAVAWPLIVLAEWLLSFKFGLCGLDC